MSAQLPDTYENDRAVNDTPFAILKPGDTSTTPHAVLVLPDGRLYDCVGATPDKLHRVWADLVQEFNLPTAVTAPGFDGQPYTFPNGSRAYLMTPRLNSDPKHNGDIPRLLPDMPNKCMLVLGIYPEDRTPDAFCDLQAFVLERLNDEGEADAEEETKTKKRKTEVEPKEWIHITTCYVGDDSPIIHLVPASIFSNETLKEGALYAKYPQDDDYNVDFAAPHKPETKFAMKIQSFLESQSQEEAAILLHDGEPKLIVAFWHFFILNGELGITESCYEW